MTRRFALAGLQAKRTELLNQSDSCVAVSELADGRPPSKHSSMYFWRVGKLKSEMVARPLSDRETLPYLVIFVTMFVVIGYIPQSVANVWDALGAVWSVALAVLGTIYIYRQNRGADGQHFLQRYLAIGWVVSIRWLVIIFFAAVVFFTLMTPSASETEKTTWYEFLFLAVGEAVVYWRIGYHVRDLAQRAATT